MVDYDKVYLSENVIQYKFKKVKNGFENFTFQDFLNHEKNASEFTRAITRALEDSRISFKAYFWECPPVRRDTVSSQFEFVTVRAPSLTRIGQDYSSFREQFNKCGNKLICSFLNLGGNALLVAPLPDKKSDFAHLARFNEEADELRRRKLWENVAEEFGKALYQGDSSWKWLSTSGLGVYYLHVRIDDYPKYYQYQPYKTLPGGSSTLRNVAAGVWNSLGWAGSHPGSSGMAAKQREKESMDDIFSEPDDLRNNPLYEKRKL